ncbi:hypothetical protein [Roseateles amylovorans]|uniref:Uncharacterized protein n=1 Tax=Roseateles amylovorans TaxID=2978473 RepID=A0ABY6AW54_9BURK|nr:hypothetical protein [Roseateles amylovorans]UXH76629.1 hypothetical protein N4261_16460 [Roseateles amylovorans]
MNAMDSASPPTAMPVPTDALKEGVYESRDEIRKILRQSLQLTAEQGGRELFWLDSDFSEWPLSDEALLEALHRWALPHRRLHLLAMDYEALRRAHPRFVEWRRLHDHVIIAKSFDPADLDRSQPSPSGVLLAPGLLVFKQWSPVRASLTLRQAREEATVREWFDAIEQRSTDSFGSSTLGL